MDPIRNVDGWGGNGENCELCPGRVIDPTFDCCNSNYHYRHRPVAFYEKLFKLNEIRESKKVINA